MSGGVEQRAGRMSRTASGWRRESLVVLDGMNECYRAKRREGKDAKKRLSPDVGSVFSLALRLRKRKSGADQTQMPKKVAMSPKVGAFIMGPPRYPLRAA